MRFYTDDYFHIGAAHLGAGLPCQDYALSRAAEDGSMAYAIVADGCSTGGRTDSGSRVVAHTAEVAIRDDWLRTKAPDEKNIPELKMHQKVLMQNARQNLGLLPRDLLATCSYAYVSATSGYVHMRGDGVIAFVHTDGSMILRRYDWANNMPLYPAYAADNFESFARAHGSPAAEALTEDTWLYDRDRGCRPMGVVTHSVARGIDGITVHLKQSGGRIIDRYAYIAVFTDGVTQIDGVAWTDAVVSLLAFKSVAGSFAKRRMISFIKDAQKKGKGPIDDIAYAVVRISSEEEA